MKPIELVFECKNGVCGRGFLGFHILTNHHCRQILNVSPNDKIYPMLESKLFLKDNFDGIYSVTFGNDPGIKDLRRLEYTKCIHLDDSENLSVHCHPNEIKKLTRYSSVEEAFEDYVSKTRTQQLQSYLLTFSFPLIFLLLLIGRHSKFGNRHKKKFLAAIVFCTLFGILMMITWAHYLWNICGLLGILYLIIRFCVVIYSKFFEAKHPD